MTDDSERTLYEGRTSLRGYAPALLLFVMLFLMLLLLLIPEETRGGAGVFIFVVLGLMGALLARVYATSYTLTQRRAVERTGVFTRKTSEVELGDVRNVQVSRDLVQRLLGVGDVGISTAGQGGIEVRFRGIREWERVAEIVRTQRQA